MNREFLSAEGIYWANEQKISPMLGYADSTIPIKMSKTQFDDAAHPIIFTIGILNIPVAGSQKRIKISDNIESPRPHAWNLTADICTSCLD